MRMRALGLGLLAIIASCVGPTSAYTKETGNFYGVRFVSCADGDTCTFLIPWLPAPFTTIRIRMIGIDTPERNGKCKQEKELAEQALMATDGWLSEAPTIDLLNVQPAGLYGRHEADIVVWNVDEAPVKIADLLLESGLAVKSKGKRTKNWCKEGQS